jgi:hypothetical protein
VGLPRRGSILLEVKLKLVLRHTPAPFVRAALGARRALLVERRLGRVRLAREKRKQHLRQGLRRRRLAERRESRRRGLLIKFKDTFSRIQGNSLVYGTIDLGQGFTLLDGATKVTVGPFAGFNFWQETQVGYGARCNRDDVDGAVCGPPGFIAVPFSTKSIQNQPNWASLRLGGEPG